MAASSQINVKAAAITGGVIGLLCWFLIIPYSYSGYGMMGYMMGYGTIAPSGTMVDIFHNYSILSVVLDSVFGAAAGATIALVYNWAVKLK